MIQLRAVEIRRTELCDGSQNQRRQQSTLPIVCQGILVPQTEILSSVYGLFSTM